MNEAEEVFDAPFVADDEAAEVLKPGEQPFDLPAPPVAAQRAAVLGAPPAVGAIRRDEFDALFEERLIQPVVPC